jgi:VanZ family protein
MNKNFLSPAAALSLWAAVIIILSSLPGDRLPDTPSLWQADKIIHFLLYAVFGVLCVRYLIIQKKMSRRRALWMSFLIGIAFGGLDELHQAVIPYRTVALQDFIADSSGILAAITGMRMRRGAARG